MRKITTPTHLPRRRIHQAAFGSVLAIGTIAALPGLAASPCLANPDARKRPVMLAAACNPCAAKKKACGACNPCAAKRACGACNPCAGASVKASQFKRPCGAGVDPTQARALLAEGERLWKDPSIGSSGLSCDSCHKGGGNLNATFAQPYPHRVAMPAKMAGAEQVHADEMVQFCMIVPMQSEPLPWTSRELAALTAYTAELQKGFNPCAAKKNPCNPCNPCAAKRACGACNPCAAKKNPCNPCNPCAAKKKSG